MQRHCTAKGSGERAPVARVERSPSNPALSAAASFIGASQQPAAAAPMFLPNQGMVQRGATRQPPHACPGQVACLTAPTVFQALVHVRVEPDDLPGAAHGWLLRAPTRPVLRCTRSRLAGFAEEAGGRRRQPPRHLARPRRRIKPHRSPPTGSGAPATSPANRRRPHGCAVRAPALRLPSVSVCPTA
jgi:hypothetical protein